MVGLVVAAPRPAIAARAVIDVRADAFVVEGAPTAGFPDAVQLAVGKDTPFGEVVSVLAFDLATLPTDALVGSASLSLRLDGAGGGLPTAIDVFAPVAGVDPQHASWNTLPDLGALATSALLGPATGMRYAVDVTDIVRAWLQTPARGGSLVLRAAAVDPLVNLGSRESEGGTPQLVIEYVADSAPEPTPTPAPAGERRACSAGTFRVHTPPTGDAALAGLATIVFEEGVLTLPGVCDDGASVRPRLRTDKLHGTGSETVQSFRSVVRARWRSCKIRLQGTLDDTCGTFVGRIRADRGRWRSIVATTTYGESVRFGTFNVQMLPSFFNAGTREINAYKIAERIILSGYDFIALNEAFDENLKSRFVRGLTRTYPYYVEYIGGDTPGNEDSGLMLFSRYPFVDLSQGFEAPGICVDPSGCTRCRASDCSKVAFYEFIDCANADCLAEKGVALVRIKNPESGRVYNTAFAHTQASYPEDPDSEAAAHYWLVRRQQLLQIGELMHAVVDKEAIRDGTEELLLLGDLNVDGDLADPDLGGDDPSEFLNENIFEWSDALDPFAWLDAETQLRDAWAHENAPRVPELRYDRGLTNRFHWGVDSDGARLDYVLRRESNAWCVQHMTLGYNLFWSPRDTGPFTEGGIGLAGRDILSDHIGVNADYNVDGVSCSPSLARVLELTPGELDIRNGKLGHPGSVAWYRIDAPGTYAIGVVPLFDSRGRVDFRAYEGKDLSRPLAQYKNETKIVRGSDDKDVALEKFRVDEPPLYVKVFNQDRGVALTTYQILAEPLDCSTREDACALGPAQILPRALPAVPPVGRSDETWYELHAQRMPDGRSQRLRFSVDQIMGVPDAFRLEVYAVEGDALTLVAQDDVAEPADLDVETEELRLDATLEHVVDGHFYMVVKRYPNSTTRPAPPYPTGAQSFSARWFTNLSIVSVDSFYCREENDGLDLDGDDEMYLDYISVDDAAGGFFGSRFLGDFDKGNVGQRPLIDAPLYFLDSVYIQLFEDDDTGSLGDDIMHRTLAPLHETVPSEQRVTTFTDERHDGRYDLRYTIVHAYDAAP